ncbi:MAG: hypothetical protein ABIS47_09750 [Acidimicrobiales bacterium]
MDEVRGAIREADKQLEAVGTLYEADLALQRVSPTLRGKINGFLGNQRAALDHLAAGVVAAVGSGGDHTHYPYAAEEAGFEASLDKNMPGLRDQRPDVAAVLARHQPFAVPALARLRDLLNDPTQQRLIPETRDRPTDPTLAEPEPGGEPTAAPRPAELPSATAGGIGLSGGIFINGVELDPVTLQRREEELKRAQTLDYVDWRFGGSDASARATLEAISAAVRAAVDEVSAVAGLAAASD